MKFIKNLKLIGKYLIATITLFATLSALYFQFIHKDIINIEIKTIDKVQLTNTANVKDLTVKYLYQDSVNK